MHEYLVAMKRALKDKEVNNLVCISRTYKSDLVRIIEKMPNTAYLSEWRYGMGVIKYVYRIHNNKIGSKLKEAFDAGAKGGHPTLTGIYSKNDLENLINNF